MANYVNLSYMIYKYIRYMKCLGSGGGYIYIQHHLLRVTFYVVSIVILFNT